MFKLAYKIIGSTDGLRMTKRFKKHITFLNSVSGVILQFISIASGLIIPRLIIAKLGSETNGLVVSLTQLLNWIYIFEGGLELIIMSKLYKPLQRRDNERISSIVVTARRFYKRISYFFIVYAFVISGLYPFVTFTTFSFGYVSTLALLIAFTIFVQYNLTVSLQQLLRADKKAYIVSIIQSVVVILNTLVAVVILNLEPDIHLLKLLMALVYLLQPLLNMFFVKKYFVIDNRAKIDCEVLKGRWSGIGINVANFVHVNTDVLVLTVLATLDMVSVYSVYALVTTGLKQLVAAFSSGISPTLGHAFASGDDKMIKEILLRYEFAIFFLVTILFTVGGLLITPFVQLYIAGTGTSALYYQPLLGVLLVLSEAIACIREPYINLAYLDEDLKATTKYAYIEAFVNIVVSVILVLLLGVVGVAIGTLLAMTIRTCLQVLHTRRVLKWYSARIFLKRFCIFALAVVLTVLAGVTLFPVGNIQQLTWGKWIGLGCAYGVLSAFFVVFCNFLFSGDFRKIVLHRP